MSRQVIVLASALSLLFAVPASAVNGAPAPEADVGIISLIMVGLTAYLVRRRSSRG
jgi:hypothetical protein